MISLMACQNAPALPGYYFDEEKNRYFKLIPGQEHINPLTGRPIVKKKSDESFESCSKTASTVTKTYSKNACWHLNHRETFNKSVANKDYNMLASVIIQTIESGSPKKTFVGYKNWPVLRCLPSLKGTELLMQVKPLILVRPANLHSFQVSCSYDCYNFVSELGASVADFSFASSYDEGMIAAVVCPSGLCRLYFSPSSSFQMQSKQYHKDIIACRWHEDYITYSVGSKFVMAFDLNRHFRNGSAIDSGAEIVKPRVSSSLITALECCKRNLLYAGCRSGFVFGYDRRILSRESFYLNAGSSGKNVCSIKALSNGCQIITRHGNTVDFNCLWDVRFPTSPILRYGTFENSKNIGFRGIYKDISLDFHENVMSCNHIDGMVRFWDIKNGNLLSATSKLESAIFSETWPCYRYDAGIIGIKKKRFVWLPVIQPDKKHP